MASAVIDAAGPAWGGGCCSCSSFSACGSYCQGRDWWPNLVGDCHVCKESLWIRLGNHGITESFFKQLGYFSDKPSGPSWRNLNTSRSEPHLNSIWGFFHNPKFSFKTFPLRFFIQPHGHVAGVTQINGKYKEELGLRAARIPQNSIKRAAAAAAASLSNTKAPTVSHCFAASLLPLMARRALQ